MGIVSQTASSGLVLGGIHRWFSEYHQGLAVFPLSGIVLFSNRTVLRMTGFLIYRK